MVHCYRYICVLIFPIITCAKDHVPIVLVHGIFSDSRIMVPTERYIKKYVGENVYIKNINLGLGKLTSLLTIHAQADYFREAVQSDPNLKHGFHCIAHSQGGLVARYYLQKYNNPPMRSYISWGSPHQGVFGMPSRLDNRFKWLDAMQEVAHHIFYSKFFQKCISFAGYWRDTLHYEKYLAKATLLPYLNNEIEHADTALFKQNICALHHMVLVMTTYEDTVEPSISCHFGFYQKGSKTIIEELFDTELYKEDKLGLKTLHESGRLHLKIAHCKHARFPKDEDNFVVNTLPYLGYSTTS